MSRQQGNILENEEIEIRLLLQAVREKYGYDFGNYSQAHVKRRIMARLHIAGLRSISEMTHEILYKHNFIDVFLTDLSINVTEMFRDPPFYVAIREHVVPLLRTYPFIKIWHAGCASGEEVYSMAIVLAEEGLLPRTQIYATDFNPVIIRQAKDGIYPIHRMKEFTLNYQRGGGKGSFSDYYTANYESVRFHDEFRENIVFATHNLVTDSVFAEVNMVVCRNVMIYFDRILQDKVIALFDDALPQGGVLCLGSKESLRFSTHQNRFEALVPKERIYKKKYQV